MYKGRGGHANKNQYEPRGAQTGLRENCTLHTH